jgi:hypothetical protein
MYHSSQPSHLIILRFSLAALTGLKLNQLCQSSNQTFPQTTSDEMGVLSTSGTYHSTSTIVLTTKYISANVL